MARLFHVQESVFDERLRLVNLDAGYQARRNSLDEFTKMFPEMFPLLISVRERRVIE